VSDSCSGDAVVQVDVDERPQRRHQARSTRLRGDARGCDGCVR